MLIGRSPLKMRSFGALMAIAITGLVGFACGGSDDNATAASGDGGTDGSPTAATGPLATKLSRPSHGSAMDVSEDDVVLVNVNHDVGTLSVFGVTHAAGQAPTLTKTAEIAICDEPWQVTLSPSAESAYVVCRRDQKVVRVDGLRTATPTKGMELAVGSEPTSIALTPKGTSAWVANWMDGTAMQIDTASMTLKATVDLNAALVATGALGNVTARPALAHPRSIVITNNNDDIETDESIYVTEYFAQTKEALAANGSNADVAKQGFVYRIAALDNTTTSIPLLPVLDIGFQDHTGGRAGCYPNQLQSIQASGSFVYVMSICVSPKGQIGDSTVGLAACTADASCKGPGGCDTVKGVCKTNCAVDTDCGAVGGKCGANNVCATNLIDVKSLQTPMVQVIDTGKGAVIANVALNHEFQTAFDAKAFADDSSRRMPLNPSDIAFLPGTLNGYIPAKGADAVFRVDFNETYATKAIDSVGSADKLFTPLDTGTFPADKQGRLPIAIAMAHKATATPRAGFAFVLNDATRNVTILDMATDAIAGSTTAPAVTSTTAMPTDALVASRLEGRRLFGTGLGRWSLNAQAWGACETCHIDGLSDQVTWFHLRGDRQTISLDQTYNKNDPTDVRFMNWQSNVEELPDHETGALRQVIGGAGAIVHSQDIALSARINYPKYGNGGLNGSVTAAVDSKSPSTLVAEVNVDANDWPNVAAYVQTIRSPKKPSNLDAAQVDAGRTAFTQANCQGCHGGAKWTISKLFYTPDPNVYYNKETGTLDLTSNLNAHLKTVSWSARVTAAGLPVDLLPATGSYTTMRYSGPAAGARDAMTCTLRNVSTYGVAESGVGIAEYRGDMVTLAQGNDTDSSGYNIPALIGLGVNAPYFHAGQARTLEAVLSDTFAAHSNALANALPVAGSAAVEAANATKRAALVQFLLSIDKDTATIAAPALGPTGGDFCATN